MPRLLALVLVALAACAARPSLDLALDADELARRGAPTGVVERLRREPFAYFRMLAEPFELRVCSEFAQVRPALPMVAVEGDAHVEQFAATRTSYGLDDFDRAGFGPAVIDLVRYATSLHLTCGQVRFPCDADRLAERFLDRYRQAIASSPSRPASPPKQPAVVARLRQRAPTSTQAWMEALERSLSPLAPEEERELRALWSQYARQGGAPPEVVSVRGLHSGLGSTTTKRALFRVRGDLLVEVRRGAASHKKSCVWRGPTDETKDETKDEAKHRAMNEAMTLLVMSRLRREMPRLHGVVLGQSPAWLQSWDSSYVELSLRDLTSQADLEELVDDAAFQLARPAATGFPDLLRHSHRRLQLDALDRTRARVLELSRTLAAETIAAWRRFCQRRPR